MNAWHVKLVIVGWLTMGVRLLPGAPDGTALSSVLPTPETILFELRAACLAHHPLAMAAQKRAAQAQQGYAGTAGYFDTTLSGSAGTASWSRSIPGSTLGSGIVANGATFESGIERALRPGLFIGAGLAERRLTELGEGRDDLYQSLAGVQLRVPLLKNRGHAEWRWEQRETEAAITVATQEVTAVRQQLCLETDTALINLFEATSGRDAYRQSAQRARALVAEAEELVRLKAVPAYQVHAARLDAALQEEQVAMAEHGVEAARIRLRALVGALPASLDSADGLVEWAGRCPPAPPVNLDDACSRRGVMAAAEAMIEQARAAAGGAREAMRPDLALALTASWQGEDTDQPWGSRAQGDGETLGADAALVWRVPLERRRERATWRAREARVAEQEALRDQQRRLVSAEIDETSRALDSARERLGLVRAAVEDATRALEAEAERFRLGEGRSRNVLDAQKDLITTILRRETAAGAVLRSQAALAYARGYPEGLLPPAADLPMRPEPMLEKE
ncbi:MAG: TolC family protein [Lentisphaerae bacterium]|nr:TolC family protein [Lentisphaerota bacterium]